MPDQKLSIQIETTATGQGVQQTAAGIKDVTNAANQAAPALGQVSTQSKNTAQELGRGVEIGNAAVATLANIGSSGQGGAAGLIAITRAGFSAGTMFKGLLASMGPFGIAAAAVGIALGLISTALRKSEESAEAARKKLEELNQQKLDKAVAEQGKLRDAAGEAIAKIEAEFNALERIADSEANLRKSRIDADESLSSEEKDRQKLAVDRQREDEKRAALLGKEEAQARRLEDTANASAAAARKESEEFARKKAALEELTAARKSASDAEAIADLESRAQSASPMAGGGVSAETLRAQQAARERLRSAEAGAFGITPDMVAEGSESEAKVKRMQTAATEDQKRAQAARAAADLERSTQEAENRRLNETRRNQDAAKREPSEAEKAAAEAAKAKREAEIKRTPAALWNNRIASGGVDASTAAEVAAAFPGYKFAEIPEWRRKKESPAITPTSMADVQAENEARRKAEEEKRRTSGGTMTTPDGRVIPVAAPTAPAPAGGTIMGPGGQIQTFPAGGQPAGPGRGAYREPASPGSDNKLADQTKQLNDTMQSAGDKAADKVDLQPAVDGAKKVQEGQEQLKTALDDMAATQAAAFGEAAAAQRETVATLTNHAGQIRSLKSELAAVRAQARAAKVA